MLYCLPITSEEFQRKVILMTEQLILEPTPLSAIDRCDRCGAQAYVRAMLLNGGELLFCAHHAKEYAEGLKKVTARIQDETEKLVDANNDTAR
jgi:hypothetical protein